jgi:hypothetical protein
LRHFDYDHPGGDRERRYDPEQHKQAFSHPGLRRHVRMWVEPGEETHSAKDPGSRPGDDRQRDNHVSQHGANSLALLFPVPKIHVPPDGS